MYDINGKGWLIRPIQFDDYILSITEIWMGQFNTYNPIHSEENKEGNRED